MIMIAEQYDAASDKAARAYSTSGGTFVVFGARHGGRFVVSHAKPSRTYKSTKTAHNAMVRWVYHN